MEKDQIWRHAKVFKPPKFNKPEDLLKLAYEYFAWSDEHPITKEVTTFGKKKGGDDGEMVQQLSESRVQRPYTLFELCVWCGITNWTEYKKEYATKKGFTEVFKHLEAVVAGKQVCGALSGSYNANLVSRLNGIVERTESTVNMQATVKSYDELLKIQSELKDEY